jgi:hypothetical protein
MSRDILWIGFLLLVAAVLKYRPDWFNRLVIAVAGKAIGKVALAQQPDRITMMPGSSGPARPEAKAALDTFRRRGFTPAGSFSIPEMQGLPVHLLVRPEESVVAVVYEHPKAGVWCDLVSRFEDGTSFTITNAKMGGGLEPRPGHTTVRAPGLTPAALHIRLLRERPRASLVTVAAADAPRVFENAYAEETAWRKNKGLSTQEVRNAAFEKTA